MNHVGMSQSATAATRNEATQSWKIPKVSPFAKLTRGTAIATPRERLRTVARRCERCEPLLHILEETGVGHMIGFANSFFLFAVTFFVTCHLHQQLVWKSTV